MEESENTGVIYVITNVVNDKKYIGKAQSYLKNGSKHGAIGRLKRHVSDSKHNIVHYCTMISEFMEKIILKLKY